MTAFLMALWGIITFALEEVCVFLPLYLVGLPLAWWAQGYAKRGLTTSRLDPTHQVTGYTSPWLDWWVGNYEDGITQDGYTPLGWFVRNPVTNLRFTPIISTLPSVNTKWVGTANQVGVPGWFLAWAHGYVGYRWQGSSWGLWIGWKVNPRDADPLAPKDYRSFGLGTALQLLRP